MESAQCSARVRDRAYDLAPTNLYSYGVLEIWPIPGLILTPRSLLSILRQGLSPPVYEDSLFRIWYRSHLVCGRYRWCCEIVSERNTCRGVTARAPSAL